MRGYDYRGVVIFVLSGLLALSLACAAAEPTLTPIPPVPPAAPVAPTPASTPTVDVAPGLPTPTAVLTIPTRVLPTATPVVTGKVQYGGTLRFALTRSLDTMDPSFSRETGFRPVMFSIYNNLLQMAPDGSLIPDLARSWDIPADGKTVTFHLQKDVKFHDGTTLDAQAVKWNYDRYMDAKSGSFRRSELVPPLERIEVMDDQTIRFYLASPFRPLLALLATERAGHLASPTAVQKLNSYADLNGEFGRRPVGSGPFKVKEWVPGSYLVLDRNDGYWEKGKPYLDGIRLPLITDSQVRFAMLRTGELDIMQEMQPSDVTIAEKNPSIKVIRQDGARWRFIGFRISVKPWDNKALRDAYAYATDRNVLVNVMYSGLATPAYQPIGPVYGVWYDPAIKPYEFNSQKAREKLAEAGYAQGFSYVQPCGSIDFEIRWCETLQAMFATVGIKMEIRLWENVRYWSDFVARKHDGPFIGGISPRADPHIAIQRNFHSQAASNPWDYKNSEFDRLVEEAATIYDVAKAKDLYRKIVTMIADGSGVIFHVYEVDIHGFRDTVRNFATFPDREVRLKELWFAK